MIPNHAFHGLFRLHTLILDNLAALKSVEALAFHDLNSLHTIQMHGCRQLTYLDPFAFFDDFKADS